MTPRLHRWERVKRLPSSKSETKTKENPMATPAPETGDMYVGNGLSLAGCIVSSAVSAG